MLSAPAQRRDGPARARAQSIAAIALREPHRHRRTSTDDEIADAMSTTAALEPRLAEAAGAPDGQRFSRSSSPRSPPTASSLRRGKMNAAGLPGVTPRIRDAAESPRRPRWHRSVTRWPWIETERCLVNDVAEKR